MFYLQSYITTYVCLSHNLLKYLIAMKSRQCHISQRRRGWKNDIFSQIRLKHPICWLSKGLDPHNYIFFETVKPVPIIWLLLWLIIKYWGPFSRYLLAKITVLNLKKYCYPLFVTRQCFILSVVLGIWCRQLKCLKYLL